MRILLVSSDVPATSSMSGSPRAFSLYRHLAQRHEIHLATFASSLDRWEALVSSDEASAVFQTMTTLPSPGPPSFWGRQRHRVAQAPAFVTRFRSPRDFRLIQWRIAELVRQTKADVLCADGLPAAQYLRDFPALPRIVDAHDAVSLAFRRAAAYAGSRWQRWGLRREGRSIRRFEVATVGVVDAYIVNSPEDRDALRAYRRDMNVSCIPNGVDTEYFAPAGQKEDESTVVFTGVMSFAPNRDAAHFFCARILPRIRTLMPEVQMQFVGSDPPDDVRALSGNGITVTGTVPDVRPFVQRAAVCVSPLRFGTGVKNKVLAALAMEKAVVATPESCPGLDVRPGQHLLVARTAEDFAGHVVALLGNRARRRQLGLAGRDLVVRRYGWAAIARQFEALLEHRVSRGGDSPAGSAWTYRAAPRPDPCMGRARTAPEGR